LWRIRDRNSFHHLSFLSLDFFELRKGVRFEAHDDPKFILFKFSSFGPAFMGAPVLSCEEGKKSIKNRRSSFLALESLFLNLALRDRITDGKLFLYTVKSGTAVYCPLPSFVTSALESIPTMEKYFFWTGKSKIKSAVGDWQRSLKRLFILAGVPAAHAHRFRDTLSVELLQAGVPIERVSIMLGHRSVRVTEKHYNAWTLAGQHQAESDVRRTWDESHDVAKGTQKVREKISFVN